jgi:FixJ family two-component response regulator
MENNEAVPPIDVDLMAHFTAIHDELTERERAIVERVMSGLTAAEVRRWFLELSMVSVSDAAARIRALLEDTEEEEEPS